MHTIGLSMGSLVVHAGLLERSHNKGHPSV